MYIINPKIQEINIPGIRKLRGGDPLSDPILKRLKAEKKFLDLEKNKTIIKKDEIEKKENSEIIDRMVPKKK